MSFELREESRSESSRGGRASGSCCKSAKYLAGPYGAPVSATWPSDAAISSRRRRSMLLRTTVTSLQAPRIAPTTGAK